MKSESQQSPSRRSVLRGLAIAAPVATLASSVAPPAEAYDPGPEETRQRYRETDDVKAFYRTNGYETLKK